MVIGKLDCSLVARNILLPEFSEHTDPYQAPTQQVTVDLSHNDVKRGMQMLYEV